MLSVCRVCFASNMNLCSLNNNLLQLYQHLANDKFNSDDKRPRAVCCYCYQRLLKCYTFSKMLQKSEQIFSNLLQNSVFEVTEEAIVKFNYETKYLSITKIPQTTGNTETTEFSRVCIKEENNGESTDDSSNIKITITPIKNEPVIVKVESLAEDDFPDADLINCQNTVHPDKDKDQQNNINIDNHVAINESSPSSGDSQSIPIPSNIFIKRNQDKSVKLPVQKKSEEKHIKAICSVCDKSFPEKSCLIRHIRMHTGEKPFPCTECPEQFTQKVNLARHMLVHTGAKPYACSECDKHFGQKIHLTFHMRTHTGEKPYGCTICDKHFPTKQYLTIHMKTHTREKPFTCSECNGHFSRKNDLAEHLKRHTGDKPFSCTICDKQFSMKRYLAVHMKTHSGKKSFTCSECDKQFYLKHQLTTHIRTHTGEKPFPCSKCNKMFRQRGHLVHHMSSHKKRK